MPFLLRIEAEVFTAAYQDIGSPFKLNCIYTKRMKWICTHTHTYMYLCVCIHMYVCIYVFYIISFVSLENPHWLADWLTCARHWAWSSEYDKNTFPCESSGGKWQKALHVMISPVTFKKVRGKRIKVNWRWTLTYDG